MVTDIPQIAGVTFAFPLGATAGKAGETNSFNQLIVAPVPGNPPAEGQSFISLAVTYGTFETPEFQRQGRDFAAALKQAGHKVTAIELAHYAHLEAEEALGNPYVANGRAAIDMMGLARA